MNTTTRMTVKNIKAGMTVLISIGKDGSTTWAKATSKIPATVSEIRVAVISGHTCYFVSTEEYGVMNAFSAQNKLTVIS